jgi:hypothetical protein
MEYSHFFGAGNGAVPLQQHAREFGRPWPSADGRGEGDGSRSREYTSQIAICEAL